MEKPDIVEVIAAQGLEFKRFGKELICACPFHDDGHPSLYVNREKQVFLCRACGECGDVISFIQKLHGVSFRDALALLNIPLGLRPAPKVRQQREKAKAIKAWARATSNKIRDALRDIGERQRVLAMLRELPEADKTFVESEEARLEREWEILSDMDDDLNAYKYKEFSPEEQKKFGKLGTWLPDAACVIEMFNNREAVDGLVGELSE